MRVAISSLILGSVGLSQVMAMPSGAGKGFDVVIKRAEDSSNNNKPGEVDEPHAPLTLLADPATNRTIMVDTRSGSEDSQLEKREPHASDWKAHCPGGSIGDAKRCTFEPKWIYKEPLDKWRNYGSRIRNCEGDTAMDTSVSETSSVTNSVSETTTTEVGFDLGIGVEDASIGFSASVSTSYTEGWSNSQSLTAKQGITVKPGEEGGMLVHNQFQLSEGRMRVLYEKKADGHWIWYSNGVEVWTLVPGNSPVYTPDVGECPHGEITNDWKWWNSDYDAVVNGDYNTYDYPENSEDPNCDDC